MGVRRKHPVPVLHSGIAFLHSFARIIEKRALEGTYLGYLLISVFALLPRIRRSL